MIVNYAVIVKTIYVLRQWCLAITIYNITTWLISRKGQKMHFFKKKKKHPITFYFSMIRSSSSLVLIMLHNLRLAEKKKSSETGTRILRISRQNNSYIKSQRYYTTDISTHQYKVITVIELWVRYVASSVSHLVLFKRLFLLTLLVAYYFTAIMQAPYNSYVLQN